MFFLTIFSVILLILLEITMFVNLVLLNPKIYSETIGKYDVGSSVYKELTEYFVQFSAPTGIPAEVFNDHIDKSVLTNSAYKLTEDSVKYLSDPNAPEPQIHYDFTDIDASVNGYIEQFNKENSVEMDEETEKLIGNTINVVHSQIESKLDVMMIYSIAKSPAAASIHKYSSMLKYLMYASGAAFLVCVIIMIVIDRRHPRDLPYWFGTVCFSSALIILVPSLYLQKTKYFTGFFMRNEHIYKSVTGLCERLLSYITDAQFIMLLIGVALILITLMIHGVYVKYVRKRHHR